MPYRPHHTTMADRPIELGGDIPQLQFKSPAPPIVVQCWCGLVGHMDGEHLDRFTKSIWRRFDECDLQPLKWAIIRRRRVLARQAWP